MKGSERAILISTLYNLLSAAKDDVDKFQAIKEKLGIYTNASNAALLPKFTLPKPSKTGNNNASNKRPRNDGVATNVLGLQGYKIEHDLNNSWYWKYLSHVCLTLAPWFLTTENSPNI